jgi:hypothetical protein
MLFTQKRITPGRQGARTPGRQKLRSLQVARFSELRTEFPTAQELDRVQAALLPEQKGRENLTPWRPSVLAFT